MRWNQKPVFTALSKGVLPNRVPLSLQKKHTGMHIVIIHLTMTASRSCWLRYKLRGRVSEASEYFLAPKNIEAKLHARNSCLLAQAFLIDRYSKKNKHVHAQATCA